MKVDETSPTYSPFYASWTDDRTKPQLLREHLDNVSRRAEAFAKLLRGTDGSFIAAAKLSGLLHDLGKYRLAFQSYLNVGDRGRRSAETDHAVYGAAAGIADRDSLAIAFAVAGHHAGLHNEHQLANLIEATKYRSLERYPELLSLADSRDELGLKRTSGRGDRRFNELPLIFRSGEGRRGYSCRRFARPPVVEACDGENLCQRTNRRRR